MMFANAEDVESGKIQAAGLVIRDLPLLSWPYAMIEAIVELEAQLVLWRTRHARMVERMIGRRTGTGGSRFINLKRLPQKVFS